jgi:hypothetical protein
VNDWIGRQLEARHHQPFLSYVFLDMPSSHAYLQQVVTAMKDHALLAVFVPSITQIGECVREIKINSLPLRMDKVLELGDGISNGRPWDVRLAYKRANDATDEPSPVLDKAMKTKHAVWSWILKMRFPLRLTGRTMMEPCHPRDQAPGSMY